MQLNLTTGLVLLAFCVLNLVFLLIGFRLGRATTLPERPKEIKVKPPKNTAPFVEDIQDDPWELALTEDKEDKKPSTVKIVGGM